MVEPPAPDPVGLVDDRRLLLDQQPRRAALAGVVFAEHLRVRGDQILEDVLSVVGRLAHGDELVALLQVDARHTVTLAPPTGRSPRGGLPLALAPHASRHRVKMTLMRPGPSSPAASTFAPTQRSSRLDFIVQVERPIPLSQWLNIS